MIGAFACATLAARMEGLNEEGITNAQGFAGSMASGNVEFLGSQFNKIKRPDRADDRSFYMNIALNALAKEGYELAAITSDDYVMKRRVRN